MSMMRVTTSRSRFAATSRGLSLVELMVGIAVGLFVVAAAAMLVSTQLNDNRRLLLETQVQQDLRAAADIITHELRRAGHWPDAAQFVWIPGSPPQLNPYSEVNTAAGEVDFSYWRKPTEDGPFGFKQEGSVLKTRLALGGWQELTDGNTLRITAFSVTPRDGPPTQLPCPNLCPDGTKDCWPTLTVRELVVDLTGQAVADPAVQRSLRSVVRLRNDLVQFNVPGAPTQACPA
jgi:type IV pilus assembly protein PilW